jgi:hypothetical protein
MVHNSQVKYGQELLHMEQNNGRGGGSYRVILLIVALAIPIVIIGGIIVPLSLGKEGWESVPREVHKTDKIPGDEVIIRGYLERNDRILAIPKDGEPSLITEDQVDQIVEDGLKGEYDFRNPGWTHRIRLEDSDILPSLIIDGMSYYVILSFETNVWKTDELFDRYVGVEVELLGKWNPYTDPIYPKLSITQFLPISIREAPTAE